MMAFLAILWKFRKSIAQGAIVLGLVWFAGSWHLRGVKNEELKIQLETAKLENANEQHRIVRAWFADREACALIAKALADQQAAQEIWSAEQNRLHEKLLWEMAAVELQMGREEQARETAQSDAIEAINRAEGCEAKVTELAKSVQGWVP